MLCKQKYIKDCGLKNLKSKSIINLRNLQGELLDLTKFMDLFLVQVEPVDAIPDRNFFIDKVDREMLE